MMLNTNLANIFVVLIAYSAINLVHGSQHDGFHSVSKRAAAVWGDPVPDYSGLTLGQAPLRILRSLIFLDKRTTEFYGYDMEEVKAKILELVQEANMYFMQLRLGLVVVDVLQTDRSDLSLYTFQEYRNQRLHKLPSHDFATLISFKYSGGLAFVGGMCTSQSVMLCGFFPQQPNAMGGIFFHEVAHLMGIPHVDPNITLKVPHCKCSPVRDNLNEDCLKIPGFDHDCTAQQLANIVYKNRCLKTKHERLSTPGLAICGNGVVEDGEQCDCGLEAQCTSWNCIPHSCEYNVHPIFLWMIAISALVLVVLILLLYSWKRGFFSWLRKTEGKQTQFESNLVRAGSIQHYSRSPFAHKKYAQASQVSPCSIVVLLDGQSMNAARTPTIQRPRQPPPPPPKLLGRSTISVQMPCNVYEIPNSRRAEFFADDLSWKFDDFDSGDESASTSYYEGQPGVPTVPVYPTTQAPIQRVTVQFRGSDHTMSTECPSSSASDASLVKP